MTKKLSTILEEAEKAGRLSDNKVVRDMLRHVLDDERRVIGAPYLRLNLSDQKQVLGEGGQYYAFEGKVDINHPDVDLEKILVDLISQGMSLGTNMSKAKLKADARKIIKQTKSEFDTDAQVKAALTKKVKARFESYGITKNGHGYRVVFRISKSRNAKGKSRNTVAKDPRREFRELEFLGLPIKTKILAPIMYEIVDDRLLFVNKFVDHKNPRKLVYLVGIGADVGEALTYMHSKGHLHRDVKPDNVLTEKVRQGYKGYLSDLGNVKLGEGSMDHTKTMPGKVSATRFYAAPEQISDKATPQSDIYGLGGTIYFWATKQHPNVIVSDGRTPEEQLVDKINKPQDPRDYFKEKNTKFDEQEQKMLEDTTLVIAGCMQPDTDLRYENVAAVVSDLRQIEKGESPDCINQFLKSWGVEKERYIGLVFDSDIETVVEQAPYSGRKKMTFAAGAILAATLGAGAVIGYTPFGKQLADEYEPVKELRANIQGLFK